MIGAAVGAAVTGILIQSSGIRTALLIPVCGVALSFLLTFARRRTLAPLGAAGGSAARADRPGGDGTPPDGTVTGGTPPQRDAGARDAGARDADAVHARVTRPRSLAAGLVVVVSLLGYRARNGRSDPRRRPRRR
jgi:hypothetical protein